VTGRHGRRRNNLLDDFKKKKRFGNRKKQYNIALCAKHSLEERMGFSYDITE
jgi:hypothetical protein